MPGARPLAWLEQVTDELGAKLVEVERARSQDDGVEVTFSIFNDSEAASPAGHFTAQVGFDGALISSIRVQGQPVTGRSAVKTAALRRKYRPNAAVLTRGQPMRSPADVRQGAGAPGSVGPRHYTGLR